MADTMTLFRNFGLAPLPNVIDQIIRESVVNPTRFFDGATPVNLIETDTEVFLQIALPGVYPEKIDLHVIGRELTINAKYLLPKIEGKFLMHGLPWEEDFRESFVLPTDVNGERAAASYDRGILTVTLPKAEFAKPKTIKVLTTV